MPKYTVTNAVQQLDDEGNPKLDSYKNESYKVFVTDEEGTIYNFFKSVKPGNSIKKGDILEGRVEHVESKAGNMYWKFTSDQKPFGGNRGVGSTDNPERQESIQRQASLKQAVVRNAALAEVYVAQGKFKEAEEVLSGKHIMEVTYHFNKWNSGNMPIPEAPANAEE